MIVKPCPYCGRSNIKLSDKTAANGKKRHIAMYCNNCHCYGPRSIVKAPDSYLLESERSVLYIDGAIENWNKRKGE